MKGFSLFISTIPFLLSFSAQAEMVTFKANLQLYRCENNVCASPIVGGEKVSIHLDHRGRGMWEKEIISDGVRFLTTIGVHKDSETSTTLDIQNWVISKAGLSASAPGSIQTKSLQDLNYVFFNGQETKIGDNIEVQPMVSIGPSEN